MTTATEVRSAYVRYTRRLPNDSDDDDDGDDDDERDDGASSPGRDESP